MLEKLIAIIRGVSPENILGIVDTLVEEGINSLEVSLSNEEEGLKNIQLILDRYKDKIRIGAGTVTRVDQIHQLNKMGIDFVITPAYDDDLVDECIRSDLEIIPGVFTPQDVMHSLNRGVSVLKLFPCDAMPFNYIKSLRGPFPKARFIAVGGVSLDNLDYLEKAGFIGIAPGSDLVKRGATLNDIDSIRMKARAYVERTKYASR